MNPLRTFLAALPVLTLLATVPVIATVATEGSTRTRDHVAQIVTPRRSAPPVDAALVNGGPDESLADASRIVRP